MVVELLNKRKNDVAYIWDATKIWECGILLYVEYGEMPNLRLLELEKEDFELRVSF